MQVQAAVATATGKSRVQNKRSLPSPSIEGLQAQFGKARQRLGLREERPANVSQKRSWLTANEIKVPPVNPRKQKRVKYVGALVTNGTTLYQGLYPDIDMPLHNDDGRGDPVSLSRSSMSEDLDNPLSPMQVATMDFGNHITLPSPKKSPRKYQSHSVKREATAIKWRALLPLLLPQYADLVGSRPTIPTSLPKDHHPTTCTTGGCKQSSSILKVLCVYRARK
jgi:hypothetical protein